MSPLNPRRSATACKMLATREPPRIGGQGIPRPSFPFGPHGMDQTESMKIHRRPRSAVLGFSCMLIFLVAWGPLPAGAGDPQAVGDVVARDIDLPGYERFGHLGIAGHSLILECLNKPDPIQRNTLASFKQASRYWGARYIPGRREFWKVIAAGWSQRNFRPRFTLEPEYTAGGHINKRVWNAETKRWEIRTVMVRAKFRCDTFVRYSFEKGIGHRFPETASTPRLIYQKCTGVR